MICTIRVFQLTKRAPKRLVRCACLLLLDNFGLPPMLGRIRTKGTLLFHGTLLLGFLCFFIHLSSLAGSPPKCQPWEEQTPPWEWWPVPLGRGSAARYLCRGDVVVLETDCARESKGRVLLSVNWLWSHFFVLWWQCGKS